MVVENDNFIIILIGDGKLLLLLYTNYIIV